jgi:hypothetical protein
VRLRVLRVVEKPVQSSVGVRVQVSELGVMNEARTTDDAPTREELQAIVSLPALLPWRGVVRVRFIAPRSPSCAFALALSCQSSIADLQKFEPHQTGR